MKVLEKVFVDSVTDLRNWLEENHTSDESVWLVKWKKIPGKPYFSYDDMVDELLCFGWVDSLPKALDEERTMIRISPRNPNSNWSAINKERVHEMTEQGKMHSSGLNLVEIAMKNGRWDFLNDVDNLIIPDDLLHALQQYPKAQFYYDRFPPSSKRGILEWIKTAKLEATRKKRIAETAAKASQNIKANHPKGRNAGPRL